MSKLAMLHIFDLKKNLDGCVDHDLSTALQRLENTAKGLCKQNENIQELGIKCWIFDLAKALPELSTLIDTAHKSNLSYRVSYIDNIEWIEFNVPDN